MKKKENYSRVTGYSPLECVDPNKQHHLVKINKQIIGCYYHSSDSDWILVAGTGSGLEAALVHEEFNIPTIGIDINIKSQPRKMTKKGLMFERQDIQNLAFKDDTFSLIYSYHVLEHVSDHVIAISEFRRVLKPGGVLFIGFPNKNRIFSYIGPSQKVSIIEKIKWNLIDFEDRVHGRFENRYGAHAGFTEKEFFQDASKFFTHIYPVRDLYMKLKYSKISSFIKLIMELGCAEKLFPSNYFICIKSH